MARYFIPNTNVGIRAHLQPAFQTDSLDTIGDRSVPDKTSGGTGISELRNRYFYALGDIRVYDANIGEDIITGGTVAITSPFSLGPSTSLSPTPNYIVDGSVYTTVTLQYTVGGSFTFSYWSDQSGNFLGASNPINLTLSTANVYNATIIRAVVF